MQKLKIAAIAILFSSMGLVSTTAVAADAAAGQAKAAACAGCHGADGISPVEMYPNLKGQKAQYLAAQMKAFRDGTRTEPTMNAMAKPLSDADIDNIAAFYAGM